MDSLTLEQLPAEIARIENGATVESMAVLWRRICDASLAHVLDQATGAELHRAYDEVEAR